VEEALLRFEIKIVELCNFEDVVNRSAVVIKVGSSGDADVIHVYVDRCSKGFMFEDDVTVYVVHHSLECRRQIG